MKTNFDLSTHEKIYLYVTFWLLVTGLFLLFFFVQGMTGPRVECADGTIVEDISECPQCSIDDDCDLDQYCRVDQCVAKECITDTDCEKPGNECIYGFCRVVVEDLAAEDPDLPT